MSEGEPSAATWRVSLKLRAGERDEQMVFENVAVHDPSCSLGKFLDTVLEDLESQSLVQLPCAEEAALTSTITVFNEQMTQELDLSVSMRDHPYIVNGVMTGSSPPVLVLQSEIFMSADQVAIEQLVERRKTSNEEPHIPQRDSSLEADVMSKDDIVNLAGRKDPATKRIKREPSSSSLNSSHNSSSPQPFISEDMAERLFETISSDSASLYSAGSSSVGSPGNASLDDTSVVARQQSQKKRVLTSSRRRLSKPPPISLETLDISQPPGGTADRGEGTFANSGPSIPVLTADDGGMGTLESDASSSHMRSFSLHDATPPRPQSAKVRLSGSYSLPLAVIEEPATESGGEDHAHTRHERLEQLRRSPSPSLQVPPSPVRNPSPNTSPRSNRKTRIATRRRGSRFDGGGEVKTDGGNTLDKPSSKETFLRTRNRTLRDTRHSATVSAYFQSKVFTTIQTFPITFDIPVADLAVEMTIQGDHTVGQIKDNLWSLLRETGMIEEDGVLSDAEEFTFTYKLRDDTYELYDEQQIFQTAAVVQVWRRDKMDGGFITVEQKKSETKEEKTLNMEIGAMIGIGLYQLQFANNDELDITRRKMVAVRRYAVRSRDAMQYSMESDINFQAIPRSVREYLIEGRVLMKVYYQAGSYLTHQVDAYEVAENLVAQFIPDDLTKRERLGLPEHPNVDDYIMKVAGEESYIYGHFELIQFRYIIYCLSKRMDITLALVRKKRVEDDLCRDVTDWNHIDSSTGLTGTHQELSALTKDHTQVFTISMWDLHRKFRVRVVGLDNFRHTDIDVVYIEAGVYHGGESICNLRFTTESVPTAHPRWNQWITFDLPVRMLPKAARLCFQVVGGVRSRDMRKRNTLKNFARSLSKSDDKKSDQSDRPLHWVNMQILDHRALLRQGLLRLNLWPITNGDGTTNSAPSPMGSTAVNPDGNTSVALYIELDTYMHPVACPTGGWGDEVTRQPDSTPRKEMKEELDSIINGDPLMTLTKAQKELVWSCRNYCCHVPEALPKLLRSANWADLSQVCEVHRLLNVWRPITLEVALELLDYHFADERVRSLAVRRLEKLSNEELMLFLLQLTQGIKV